MQIQIILASLLVLLTYSTIVSAKLESLHARSTVATSSSGDHTNYYYWGAGPKDGNGHSMVENDEIIGQAMSWGVKFYFQKFLNQTERVQYGLDDPQAFRIPSVKEFEGNVTFPQGTSVMLSCYDQSLFDLQVKLNKQCSKTSNCYKDYIVASLWGTIGKMDFKTDGIVLRACVLLVVDTSGDCGFPDSPSCKTKVYKDLTKKTDKGSVEEGSIVEFGPARNIKQVTSILKNWADKNKQQITLPDGTKTKCFSNTTSSF